MKFDVTYIRLVKQYIEVVVEADTIEEVHRLFDEGNIDNNVADSDIVGEYDLDITPIED